MPERTHSDEEMTQAGQNGKSHNEVTEVRRKLRAIIRHTLPKPTKGMGTRPYNRAGHKDKSCTCDAATIAKAKRRRT